ncbi:MAG: response regulator [Gammaproteobacteria bacterium]|nr:response regulator [Gammaproteobacteria bacterium]
MELKQPPLAIRILAIDDEPAVLQQYKAIFDGKGEDNPISAQLEGLMVDLSGNPSQLALEEGIHYELSVVTDGREGLQKVVESIEKSEPYTVILLDIRMPMGWGGLETAQQIREVDQQVKIVFITAHMDYSLTEIRNRVGFRFDFLLKPINQDELVQLTLSLALQWGQEKQLESALQHAEIANRARDEFLASMSHELRTPLTTIIGNSELLEEKESDQLKLNLIHSINQAGKSQLTLVNDILDASKMEMGELVLDVAPYDLSRLIGEIGFTFSSQAMDAGIRLKIDNQLVLDGLVVGDQLRVRQIISNLLSNAIKFTNEGVVEFTASATKEQLLFVVEDSGIGISEENMRRLFDRFEQAEQSHKRRGGSGIGLYICDHLIQTMGGTIEMSSELGVGSRFQVRLPYQLSEQGAELSVVEQGAAGDQATQQQFIGKVLFADDTPEMRLLVEHMLLSLGIDVTTAVNGQEAMELALSNHYDLILMDMQMPVMDGIEATTMLRQLFYSRPIVALTANLMANHREAFEAAGCDDFLGKPIDRQALFQVLERYLDPVEAGTVYEQPDEGNLISDELSQLFIKRLSTMKITLLTALQDEQWSEIRDVAHNVKGSGTSFGHPELTRLGKELCETIDQDQLGAAPELVQQLNQEISEVVETTLMMRSA